MAEHAATVDGITFALLSAVADAAEKVGVRWMVTGASARVLLLESAYGLLPLVRDIAVYMPATDPERIFQLVQQINAGLGSPK